MVACITWVCQLCITKANHKIKTYQTSPGFSLAKKSHHHSFPVFSYINQLINLKIHQWFCEMSQYSCPLRVLLLYWQQYFTTTSFARIGNYILSYKTIKEHQGHTVSELHSSRPNFTGLHSISFIKAVIQVHLSTKYSESGHYTETSFFSFLSKPIV